MGAACGGSSIKKQLKQESAMNMDVAQHVVGEEKIGHDTPKYVDVHYDIDEGIALVEDCGAILQPRKDSKSFNRPAQSVSSSGEIHISPCNASRSLSLSHQNSPAENLSYGELSSFTDPELDFAATLALPQEFSSEVSDCYVDVCFIQASNSPSVYSESVFSISFDSPLWRGTSFYPHFDLDQEEATLECFGTFDTGALSADSSSDCKE